MNSSAKLAITLLLGASIGGVVVHQLHAQAKPPAYVIVQLGEVRDPSVGEELRSKMTAVTLAHGGKYLARTRNVTALEGKPAPQGVVIIVFENVEKALAYRNSEAYRELAPLRDKGMSDHSWIVEGLAN
jgi:Uncharacterized conserved protein